MTDLFERYDVPSQKSSEIVITDHSHNIYVSESDEVFCYVGIIFNDEQRSGVNLNGFPYFMCGKHSTDMKWAGKIKGFLRIINGCIVIGDYVDNKYNSKEKYKLVNRFVRYPIAGTYYGVMECEKIIEDVELTRKVFGLTYDELESVVECYAKVLGIYNEYDQYPRLTRSVRSSNRCDLTDLWIPEKFPYITFKESGYDFSHVSLWGFYRHIQLLMEKNESSRLGRALITAGVKEEILQLLLQIDDYSFNLFSKVTWDMIHGFN